jgi:hypothetical protein
LIVDTRLKKGIEEESNQAEFGGQLNGTLLPVAMTPTNVDPSGLLEDVGYASKLSITLPCSAMLCGISLKWRLLAFSEP